MKALLENQNFVHISEAIIYLAAALVLFLIGRLVYGFFHKRVNVSQELVKKDNLAFALSITGYYVGVLLAIGSALIGESAGLVSDLVEIGVYGLLAIILLNISSIINDKIILRKFKVEKEILEDQNEGTGIVEAANMIASGLIIFGAVSGEGTNFFEGMQGGYLLSGIISAVVFWFVGQVLMVATGAFYNLITPYNIHDHIEKDNVAVGVGFAGAIIAIANLIRFGITGDFTSWADNFSNLYVYLAFGIALLPVVRLIADKILLPGEKLTDEIINQEKPNIGAALIEAFAYIGGSILITFCL